MTAATENFATQENLRQLRMVIAGVANRLREMCPQKYLFEPPPAKPVASPIKMPAKRHWWSAKEPATVDVSVEAAAPVDHRAQAAALDARAAPLSCVRLDELVSHFGLDEFERSVVILCIAAELSCEVATLCGLIQRNNRSRPTLELAEQAFHLTSVGPAMSSHSRLRAWRLVDVDRSPMDSPLHGGLWLDGRIADYLTGHDDIDDRLSRLSAFVECDARPLPASHDAIRERLQPLLAKATLHAPVIELVGPDLSAKLQLASQVLEGQRLFRISAEQLPQNSEELDTLSVLWQRENKLGSIALFIDAEDVDSAGERAQGVVRFLERLAGGVTCFLAVRSRWRLVCDHLHEDVPRPSPTEQAASWQDAIRRAFPGYAGIDELALSLAWKFSLTAPRIFDLVAVAPADLTGADFEKQITRACQDAVRPRLEPLARRIDARATLDDIVLPETQKQVLLQIIDQVKQRQKVYGEWGFARRMNRGLGISALFSGESGTGKTMAAEVIANLLDLPLCLIDLSMVVNKYIGETEKNLARVFDAAEDGGGILFFDECDALFGKRSEVKDSHDRYANIEINYLLQRVESYRGLAILATNMKSALDSAFVRRLRFSLNFAFPDETQRREIWKKAFPITNDAQGLKGTPLESLDYSLLGGWSLTGANIQSIALNAAFRAAAINSAVTMQLIEAAARDESVKLGRPFNGIEVKRLNARTVLVAGTGRVA